MQAIETKILPATNNNPVRIKASCSRGSLTVSPPIHDKESGHKDNHVAVADLLCARFIKEDEKEYNSPPSKNPWGWRRVVGGTKAGYAHVFVE